MTPLQYLHLDVFTDRRFEGNQLAVFPSPGSLSPELMQTIAREMAFSESTFIYPAVGSGDVRMRIFTPGEELPIAGHPTIGTTFALASEGVIAPGRQRFVYELGVGPTPVTLEWKDERLEFVWMTQPRPEFGPVVSDVSALARAIGLEVTRVVSKLPVQKVSCGVPYLLAPLADRAAVDAVSVDRKRFAACCAQAGLEEVPGYFFSIEPEGAGVTTYSRMIAPGFGIAEDPATGSASGPLGSYLVRYGCVSDAAAQALVNLQGVAMGRPSLIHISIDGQPDDITTVRVGGRAVLVGRGELNV